MYKNILIVFQLYIKVVKLLYILKNGSQINYVCVFTRLCFMATSAVVTQQRPHHVSSYLPSILTASGWSHKAIQG